MRAYGFPPEPRLRLLSARACQPAHDLRQQIQLRAERDKKPQAQVIRELLEKGMQVEKPPMSGEGLLKIARLAVKGAPPGFSENIDTYLYEKP